MIEIDDFTKKFTDEKLGNVVKVRRNFFHVSDELMNMKTKIGKEPFAIGTYLGTGKPFHPSTALIDWIGQRTDKSIVVDKKAAWLFLCGRDIFERSIINQNVDRGLVIVKNENEEILGLAELTGRRVAAKHLIDKGDFLRRERH